MRIRLKFEKQGSVKFVGHLDTVRLFQRACKVAQIPLAYSQGFNPHSLVYFAMPLAVGMSSIGEYMDVVTTVDIEPTQVMRQLNAVLVEGITITKAFVVDLKGESLMSLVQAADYKLIFKKEELQHNTPKDILEKLSESEILVEKKGKKGIKEVDIKPMILNYSCDTTEETVTLQCHVLAGSSQNLSPELLAKAVLGDLETIPYIAILREELYTDVNGQWTALEDYGRI